MAEFIVMACQIWGVIGALVAIIFLTVGMDRIDEDAKDAYVFRPLLIPGILMIWPLVLWRWWQIERQTAAWATRYRPWRTQHALAAVAMTAAIGAALIIGLSVRQNWPADAPAIQISGASNE